MHADTILNELRIHVKTSLGQTNIKSDQKDGMDMAICIIDRKNKSLQYAGAFSPLYLIRKNNITNTFNFTEFKADRMPIGVYPKDNQSFQNNLIQLSDNDVIYIFSDGFSSQFGGDKGDTFKTKKFQNALLSLQNEPLNKQKDILESTLADWQGKHEQVDDILVMGLKIGASF
jgi:serine phosphatase RsbU (regulator of sigma subunit)